MKTFALVTGTIFLIVAAYGAMFLIPDWMLAIAVTGLIGMGATGFTLSCIHRFVFKEKDVPGVVGVIGMLSALAVSTVGPFAAYAYARNNAIAAHPTIDVRTVEYEERIIYKQPIISMRSGSNVLGQFMLGSGYVQTRFCYVVLQPTANGGYTPNTLTGRSIVFDTLLNEHEAHFVFVKEYKRKTVANTVPRLYVYMFAKTPRATEWKHQYGKDHYKIYVPEGTVTSQFTAI